MSILQSDIKSLTFLENHVSNEQKGTTWLVVSNICFHPYLGKYENDPIWLINIFQMGWNHQLV